MEIQGKRAVVTGAGSGIGRGIALALAEAGAAGIIVADVEGERAQAVAGEITAKGVAAQAAQCDVRRVEAVTALADAAWARLGGVDLLFNNAGVVASRPAFEATEDDLIWEYEVNVLGVMHGCRVFGRRFLQQEGRAWICNTASENAVGTPFPNVAGYVATKHAVLGYTDALRLEHGEKIGFSALCPGVVATNVWNAGRNRPQERGGAFDGNPQNGAFLKEAGLDPLLVGRWTVEGVRNEDFFIWTHAHDIELMEKRLAEARVAWNRRWG